jgi:mono/diheme cytochrome c family protein
MEVIIQRSGEVDWRVDRTFEVPEIPAQDQIPGPPPRFEGFQAIGAPIGLALAVIFGVVSARNPFSTEPDRILGWLAVMFLVLAALTMWQTLVDTTPTTQARNPILMTPQSVETGREIYLEHCVICHGPEGQGDGEAAPDVERPVADLSGPHVDIHTDGDLYWWIMDGIDPAMPGFESELSEEEAWHLVNYIRSLRDPVEEHEMHMGASD